MKNEGSPEFRLQAKLPPAESPLKSKHSFESEKTRSSGQSQRVEEDGRRRETEPTEDSAIETLKEELRRKEEAIKRLLEYDRGLGPVHHSQPDPQRSLTPMDLYQMSSQIRSPNAQAAPPFSHSPINKHLSISPFRGDQRDQSVFVSNGALMAQKEQAAETLSLLDMAKHPAFQQPKYTTKHPKVHEDNPITGLSRQQTNDHSPLAGYGAMLFPASKAPISLRRML